MRIPLCALTLAVLLGCGAMQARADTCNGFTNNLLSNCGFESGNFQSWTGSTTTSFESGVDQLSPYEGNYSAYLGSVGSTTTLTQSLATTPGTTYLIEFALMNDTDPSLGNTNSFSVLFDGSTLFSATALAANPYELYTISTAANAQSTNLSFISRNDVGDFDLDSISVTAATPEPSSWILLGTGFGCVALLGRSRRRVRWHEWQ